MTIFYLIPVYEDRRKLYNVHRRTIKMTPETIEAILCTIAMIGLWSYILFGGV